VHYVLGVDNQSNYASVPCFRNATGAAVQGQWGGMESNPQPVNRKYSVLTIKLASSSSYIRLLIITMTERIMHSEKKNKKNMQNISKKQEKWTTDTSNDIKVKKEPAYNYSPAN